MARTSTRWLTRAALIGGAAAAGAISGMRARRERRMGRAPGLDEAITINRDRLGIPHIVAASWQDALFGLGFAVAEDRLWQMDLSRRVGMGKLSEIIGPEGLDSDRLMRLIGLPRIAHRLVDLMTDEERVACERFAAGVNHFIEAGGLPVEFRALRYEPSLWTPADSVAVFRMLAWSISGALDADLTAEQLHDVIGAEWANVIYRGGFEDREPMMREHQRPAARPPIVASRMPIFPPFGASNAWAVSAERSITRGALLANDPHLELRNPSIWWEARIEAPGFRISGVTTPGVPAIVVGRTPSLAWGVTAGMTPQFFLYREAIDDNGHVEHDGAMTPLRINDEFIAVKGQPDERFRVRHTPRGPLISDLRPQPDGRQVSLHWSGMEEGHELSVLLDAVRARDIDEVLPVFRRFTTPPVNVVIADSQNNIAAGSLGRMSLRSSRPGLLSPEEYPPSYIDPEELPLERNPERGWVACANSGIVGSDYPYEIYGNWAPGFRYRRIVDLLESQPRHSPNGFRNMQLDVYSLQAAEIAPLLADLIDGAVAPWIVEELRDWDYEMTVESRAALLFEAIHREWTRAALLHRLPEEMVDQLTAASGVLSVPVLFVDRVLRGELPAWMEDADRVRLIGEAASQAILWIREQLGPDADRWTWGALHRLTFRHPLGIAPGPHRRRVNAGPFPVPGGRTTVWPMVWNTGKPFDVYGGPSLRFVTDMKRPELSWITTPLGQSGSPLSRHFRDQVEDFLEGYAHSLWPDGFPPRRRRVIRP